MKRTSALALALLMGVGYLFAEVVASKNGLCGYKDSQGNLVIPYKYDYIGNFSGQGVAVMKKGNKFGMVTNQGREVLAAKYDAIGSFHDGIAILSLKNKQGLVSSTGRLLHQPEYEFIYPFNSKGVAKALVKKKKKDPIDAPGVVFALINKEGKEIYRGAAEEIRLYHEKENGYYPMYEAKTDTIDVSCGYFYSVKENACYDLEGRQVLNDKIRSSIYKQAFGKKGNEKQSLSKLGLKDIEYNPCNDIQCLVYSQKRSKTTGVRSVIYYDLKNQRVIWSKNYDITKKRLYALAPEQWFSVSQRFTPRSYHEDFAVVSVSDTVSGSKDIVINREGKEVASYAYEGCCDFKNGYMVVRDENYNYGLVNRNHQMVIPYSYQGSVVNVNSFGLWAVQNGELWGVVNTSGEVIVPFEFDDIRQMDKRDVFFVSKDYKWGAYERNVKILDCIFDDLFSFIDQTFVYQYGDEFGLYCLHTHSLSPSHDAYEGCYEADPELHGNQMRRFYILGEENVKLYGYLDGYGNKVIPFMYTDVKQAAAAYLYYRNKPTPTFTDLEKFRDRLRFSRRSRTYKLNSIVAETDWDY